MHGTARNRGLPFVQRNCKLSLAGRDYSRLLGSRIYSLLLADRNCTCLVDGLAIVDERQKSEVRNPTHNQKAASAPDQFSCAPPRTNI
jgi:hypothetical protein